jgi:hypothetical protein
MLRSKFLRLLGLLALLYAGLSLVVAMLQDKLIYFPHRADEAALIERGRTEGLEPWRDGSGAIVGWKAPRLGSTPPAANRLVVFHGNLGYAQHRLGYVEGFGQIAGGRTWEVYLFEYPGYGAREGKLGEASFIAAGLAALRTLREADARPIYLLGESLGSGLASALAGREPQSVAGVMLITPFASLTEVAAHHYPFLPVRLILRDHWDNAAALRSYAGPLAVRLAGQDEVIPVTHGRRLYEAYAGRKQLWIGEGASHNSLDFSMSSSWWEEVTRFLLATPEPR